MPHPQAKIHRMFELVEPIATVTFSTVPDEAFLALGMRNYWDGYFAGLWGSRSRPEIVTWGDRRSPAARHDHETCRYASST
jgi:hypothetical protein